MTDPCFLILYVADTARSAAFYTERLGQPPAELSPGFAHFMLPNGLHLGLWARDGVVPAAGTATGGSEFALVVTEPAEVDRLCASWQAAGVTVSMPPADLDFGRSFVATDPDGHRLRVLAPA